MKQNRVLTTFLTFLISASLVLPPRTFANGIVSAAAPSPQIADFLCERAISLYNSGKHTKALEEFKKALMANPNSLIAKKFISLIEKGTDLKEKSAISEEEYSLASQAMDNIETELPLKKNVARKKASFEADESYYSGDVVDLERDIVDKKSEAGQKQIPLLKSVETPKEKQETIIDVDQFRTGVDIPVIETNVGQRLIFTSTNIVRFLADNPDLLNSGRLGQGEVFMDPKMIGMTFAHIWDNSGMRTFKLVIGSRKIEQEFIETQQQAGVYNAELPESFKVSYSVEDNQFYTGRRVEDLERRSHTMTYNANIRGETPYGNIDAAANASRLSENNYNISNLRLGITNGHYDEIKDITLRFFDFYAPFSSFGFPASDLRGVMIDAPMFDKKLNYTAFWGALPQGNFTQLSSQSGLSPTKDVHLEGVGLNYRLLPSLNFKTFYAHSYGPERTYPVLTDKVTGFGTQFRIGHASFNTEMAYDMLNNISYSASSNFSVSKLNVSMSMTDNNKNFASVFGGVPNSGSTNGSLGITYKPTQNVTISQHVTGTRDKVFGNPDNPTRPNYYSTTSYRWRIDPHSDLELRYILDDRMGSVSPSVTETKEIVLSKRFYMFRKFNSYINFSNRKNKNFASGSQNFNNNRVLMGLSCRLAGDLNGYYNREFNFIRNKYTGETAYPLAQEMGLQYYHPFISLPFIINLRLYFRDEQDTESDLSYLSGEDRLEGEWELTFKPNPDSEIFFRNRLTNVWAEREGVAKHLDYDISWGMRLLWDTGLRWISKGGFSGFVFYDLNSDGKKQRGEKGVPGVKVTSSDGKTSVTDQSGMFKISGVKGRKAVLEIDVTTIPKGYNPTTSVSRELDIVASKVKRVDFGITTTSEISGIVFNDSNNNGIYDPGEETIKNVSIVLDDKINAMTTPLGEFMFRNLKPGEHKLQINLKSVPLEFIPKVPIVKKLKVIEGTTFIYNIPLKLQKTK